MTITRMAAAVTVLAVLAAWAGHARASDKQAAAAASVEDVVNVLAFDPDSKIARAMSDVTDRTSQWRETAFFLLLKRVAALAPLAEGELIHFDRPAYRSLKAAPQRYRGLPIRMTVRVHTVTKVTRQGVGADDLVWWELSCTDALVSAEAGPILICSTREPTGLGEPSEKTKEDERKFPEDAMLYKGAPELELACVFYKVYKGKRQDSDEARDYPVAIAWHVSAEHKAPALNPTDPRYVVGAVAIIGICLAYYFIRKYARRLGKPGPKIEYKPRRDEPDEDDDGREEEDQAVDPLLAAAAEEYERERQDRDAEDHG